MNIKIRYATIGERKKIYEWLCCSDTTELHLGEPNFAECPVPTWEEFVSEFEDYYFLEPGRKKAGIFVIMNDCVELGCVCYKMFYLKDYKAELSIWLNSSKFIGKGYGPCALDLAIDFLSKNYSVKNFIIRPSAKNFRAIKAYQKIGFVKIPNEQKLTTINEFIKPEFMDKYCEGEYGLENSVIFVKDVSNNKY